MVTCQIKQHTKFLYSPLNCTLKALIIQLPMATVTFYFELTHSILPGNIFTLPQGLKPNTIQDENLA